MLFKVSTFDQQVKNKAQQNWLSLWKYQYWNICNIIYPKQFKNILFPNPTGGGSLILELPYPLPSFFAR